MDKSTTPAAKPIHTVELEQGTFRFRRPTTPELDRYLSKVSSKPASMGKVFTLELVVDDDREAWTAALEQRPGLSTAAVQKVMEDLGFLGDYES